MSHVLMKRVGVKSVNALSLLAAFSVGVTQFGLTSSPACAQKATGNAPRRTTELKPDSETAAKSLARVQQEDFCKMQVHLKVENATLRKIAAELEILLPKEAQIEVRNANSATQFTFDLAKGSVGEILQAAASLAQCKFYVLSDRLLIAPRDQLSPAERADAKEWAKNQAVIGLGGWSARPIAERELSRAVFDELQQRRVAQGNNSPLRFGDLNNDSQQMIQSMVDWINESANHVNVRVPSNATISIDAASGDLSRFVVKIGALESGGMSRVYAFKGRR